MVQAAGPSLQRDFDAHRARHGASKVDVLGRLSAEGDLPRFVSATDQVKDLVLVGGEPQSRTGVRDRLHALDLGSRPGGHLSILHGNSTLSLPTSISVASSLSSEVEG
jgi:hypothetical protein